MDITAVRNGSEARPASRVSNDREAARSTETTEEAGTSSGIAGPLVNPALKYDSTARLAVLTYYDRSTGEVANTIPPKQVVDLYRRNGFRRAAGVDVGSGSGLTPSEVVQLGLAGDSAGSSKTTRGGGTAGTPSAPGTTEAAQPPLAVQASSAAKTAGGVSVTI